MFQNSRVENSEFWQDILRIGHKYLLILHAFFYRLLLDSFTLTGRTALACTDRHSSSLDLISTTVTLMFYNSNQRISLPVAVTSPGTSSEFSAIILAFFLTYVFLFCFFIHFPLAQVDCCYWQLKYRFIYI